MPLKSREWEGYVSLYTHDGTRTGLSSFCLSVGVIPGVASLGLAPRAVPTKHVLRLVGTPGPLPSMLREGL